MVGSAVEHRVVWVDPDQADRDPVPFQVVERRLEAVHRGGVVDPGVTEVEMERRGCHDVCPGVDQAFDRRRIDDPGGPNQPERQFGIVDVLHTDVRPDRRGVGTAAGAHVGATSCRSEPTGEGECIEAVWSARHVKFEEIN